MSDTEHRTAQRRRMLKQAQIVTNHSSSTIDCLVRDMSLGGARLMVENSLGVPGQFELLLLADNTRVPALVVWRKPNEVGIRFAAATAERAA